MAQYDDVVPAPDFSIFARELLKSAAKRVRSAYPARVLAYYPPDPVLRDPAVVDVQIARKYARQIEHAADAKTGEEVREDNELGLIAIKDLEPIPRVVVQYPGFGGMRITGPIEVGEEGLLITCDRSIDRWVRRGADPVQDPVFPHQMNWKDSIFLPGLRAGADDGFDIVPAAGWRLGADDASWELLIDATTKALSLTTTGPSVTIDGTAEVKVGANATAFAARSDLVDARFASIKAAFAASVPAVDPASTMALVNTILAFFKVGLSTAPTGAVKAKVE